MIEMSRKIIVTQWCKDGCAQKFINEAFETGFVDQIRKEDGCIQYEYAIYSEKPDRVVLIEEWENQAKHEAHLAGPNMRIIEPVKAKYVIDRKLEIFD